MVVTKTYKVGVQYGLESAWGTAVARDTAFGRVRSASINFNNNPIAVYGLGAGRNRTDQLFGNFDVNWNVDFDLHDAQKLRFIIGTASGEGAGTTASPITLSEVSKIGSGFYPPFTLEIASNDDSDEVQVAEGCVANTCTINFTTGAMATVSMSGVAETLTDVSSATSYTEPTTTPFIFSQITAYYGATPSALTRVVSGSITITQNLVTNRTLGSRFINTPELGLTDYNFSLTVLMSEGSYETLRTAAYGSGSTPSTGVSEASMVAATSNDELKIAFSEGSSSGDRNIEIELDDCVIGSISQPVSVGNNLIQATFNGTASKGKGGTPITYWTTT